MVPKVIEVRCVSPFIIHVRFAAGVNGEIDLENELHGEVFEPLRDPAYFKRVSVHPERHTTTWPTGADFAPEFLRDRIRLLV